MLHCCLAVHCGLQLHPAVARKEFRLLGLGCDGALTLESGSSAAEGTRRFELPGGLAVRVRGTSFGEGKLGYSLWTAGIGMATWLAAEPSRTAGKSVLELGSGIGLVGLTCAAIGRGAPAVTLSDMERTRADDWEAPTGLLSALEASARENGLAEHVRVARLDWREHALGAAPRPEAGERMSEVGDEERFEVVLAADCVYYAHLLQPLAATLARVLAPGGVAYVLSTDRQSAERPPAAHCASPAQFGALLAAEGGWRVEERRCTCATPYSEERMVLHELRRAADG